MSHELICRLALPPAIKLGDPVPLTFTLENPGKRTLRALTWNTPLEGFFGSYLKVDGPAGPIKYEGPMAKRGLPERDEYIVVKARGRATATVDLALPYRIAQPGRYTVTYRGSLLDVTAGPIPRAPEKFTGVQLECPAVSFELLSAS